MAAVQIAAVAARAGIAAGTVYRYFPAKTDLVAALLAEIADERDRRFAPRGRRRARAALGLVGGDHDICRARAARPQAFLCGHRRADRCRARCGAARRFANRSRPNLPAGSLPRSPRAVCRRRMSAVAAAGITGLLIEGLIGPLAPDPSGRERDIVQVARARGAAFARRGRCPRPRPRGADRDAGGAGESPRTWQDPPDLTKRPGSAPCRPCRHQLPDPESTSPKNCQVVPSNFINCICLIGAKSVALVETTMPGSSIGNFRSWMAGGLLHDVLAREVIAACPEHGDHRLRDRVAVDIVVVGQVAGGIVFLHPIQPFLVFRRVLPIADRWDL